MIPESPSESVITLIPLIGALSAGNTAVVKPSELAPATSAELSLIASRFQPEKVAVVEGDAEMTAELLRHFFDKIFFTGSPRSALFNLILRL